MKQDLNVIFKSSSCKGSHLIKQTQYGISHEILSLDFQTLKLFFSECTFDWLQQVFQVLVISLCRNLYFKHDSSGFIISCMDMKMFLHETDLQETKSLIVFPNIQKITKWLV